MLLLEYKNGTRDKAINWENQKLKSVWIFNGEKGRFSSGVFSGKEVAEKWILEKRLTGILTEYPIDEGVYDWAISNGFFVPKNDHEKSSVFIGGFSCAQQKHVHYEDGQED